MFADTITLVVAGVNKVLVKINQDGFASEYLLRETLGSFRLKIRHSTVTKGGISSDRHNVEITHTIFATATVAEIVRKVYLVFEQDKTDTMTDEIDAFADWLIAATDAVIIKLAGWES